MRVDILSIFPDYLAPLELSLPGKARAKGLLEIHVHDLREWTHDRHRTVDDTPYGGGAGMVMKPEPWGEAFDALGIDGATVVFPTPSGVPFTQALARELSSHDRLVFACGRYEGIDSRVIEHARARADVREVSIGDYVLNGGEVAALAITEAVVRLLPGFMGNPDSLVEESHEDGLLEYPVYTKPPSWRGLPVPEVLTSGDHGRIRAWRHQQAVRRTAERRPDLLHPSQAVAGLDLRLATRGDAAEILTLQRACWVQEAQVNETLDIPALQESLEDVVEALTTWRTYVARAGGRLVACSRGRLDGDIWDIGRLMVVPDLQGRGLGRQLLEHIESVAPPEATSYRLFTGSRSAENLRMYRKAGYRPIGELQPGVTILGKRRRSRAGKSQALRVPPDLLDASVTLATAADMGEIQTLQWACFDPPLHEPLDVLTEDVLGATTFVLRTGPRIVGTVTCQLLGDARDVWHLGLLMVAPDLRGRGLGRFLLEYAERAAPPTVTTYQLWTGAAQEGNLRMYAAAGYAAAGSRDTAPDVVVLTKPRTG